MRSSILQQAAPINQTTERLSIVELQAIISQVKEEIVIVIEEEVEAIKSDLLKIKGLREATLLIIKEKIVIARKICPMSKEVERKTRLIRVWFLRKGL